MKSRRRNTTEGTMDKIAGRVMEAVGKITGNPKHKSTGKAARGRGAGRSSTGKARGTARRGSRR